MKTLTMSLTSLLVVLVAACEPNPLDLEPAPQFAKGGNGKPDKEPTGDVTLITYTVASAEAPQGLTRDEGVNEDVYAQLWAEDPSVDWRAYLGCPDVDRLCSAVTLVLSGSKALSFSATVVPIVTDCGGALPSEFETCLHNIEITNRRASTIRGGKAMPSVSWDIISRAFVDDADGNPTFTFYWQGQRGTTASWITGQTEKYRGKIRDIWETQSDWDLFLDLHSQGAEERFFFHPTFVIRDGTTYHPTYSDATLLRICDTGRCWANYQGVVDKTFSTLDWLDLIEVNISGLDYVEFGVQVFVADDDNPNPESFGRVMLTHANGEREMLDQRGTKRIDYEDGTAATRYRVAVGSGCYTFDVVGLVVRETQKPTFAEDDRWVWDGTKPPSLTYGC